MKHLLPLAIVAACFTQAQAIAPTKSNIPYVENGQEPHVLDIYTPPNAKNLPVVFWIHGGGWQAGDKSDVLTKPQWFMNKGFHSHPIEKQDG